MLKLLTTFISSHLHMDFFKLLTIVHVPFNFFRAGLKLTVLDHSDKDWWQGKCLGCIGYFPSTYVIKLMPGEKPLQVMQAIQIHSVIGHEPPIKLLRDQVRTGVFFGKTDLVLGKYNSLQYYHSQMLI